MFKGMDDAVWNIMNEALPKETKRSRGMPHADFRKVLNSILWITITGARWCDLPKDKNFASKSSSHRWLLKWQRDGTWQSILDRLIQLAAKKKLITIDRLLVDGSFSPREIGRRRHRVRLQR